MIKIIKIKNITRYWIWIYIRTAVRRIIYSLVSMSAVILSSGHGPIS